MIFYASTVCVVWCLLSNILKVPISQILSVGYLNLARLLAIIIMAYFENVLSCVYANEVYNGRPPPNGTVLLCQICSSRKLPGIDSDCRSVGARSKYKSSWCVYLEGLLLWTVLWSVWGLMNLYPTVHFWRVWEGLQEAPAAESPPVPAH